MGQGVLPFSIGHLTAGAAVAVWGAEDGLDEGLEGGVSERGVEEPFGFGLEILAVGEGEAEGVSGGGFLQASPQARTCAETRAATVAHRDTETARVREIYDKMAPRYERIIGVVERLLFADGRQWACERATGRVLEVAIGTGRNLRWYGPDVQVVGVDVSPNMLEAARVRANELVVCRLID